MNHMARSRLWLALDNNNSSGSFNSPHWEEVDSDECEWTACDCKHVVNKSSVCEAKVVNIVFNWRVAFKFFRFRISIKEFDKIACCEWWCFYSLKTTMEASNSSASSPILTEEQKARIERNRQRAILLRQKKQLTLSTKELSRNAEQSSGNAARDSGAGFLIEEEDSSFQPADCSSNEEPLSAAKCDDCSQSFTKSNLRIHFDVNVCNRCGRNNEKYPLITRTEAKSAYLLKDCDLDSREPPLKFILKKNPNPMARGNMRLYLESHVEQRALTVWGTEEQLEEERTKRLDKKRVREKKQYQNKVNQLRMSVRSSLYRKESASHQHEYGPQVYNEKDEQYEKKCKTCDHIVSFEIM